MKPRNLRTFIFSTLIFFVLLLVLPFFSSVKVFYTAESKTEEEVQLKVQEYTAKLEQTKKKGASLSRDIELIENEIDLKTAQIEQLEHQILKKEGELGILREDIGLMEIRLQRLYGTIDNHGKLLGERLKDEYINEKQSFIAVLLKADGFSNFFSRIQYLSRIQEEDKALIDRMSKTKDNYEEQQELLEVKKDEVEKIKQQIVAQKSSAEVLRASISEQKEEKDHLLRVTKNDEKRYQSLLEAAKKELAQIQSAANVVVREGKSIDVKEGETIGTMGNSGFSTGAHLHFSIYKYSEKDFEDETSWGWYYSNYVNPLDYLKPKSITWGTGCYRDPKGVQTSGKGSWTWPMNSVRITQGFGSNTCYNYMYGGRPHPALDMVGVGDISIKAVRKGKAYFCRNCLKDGGNGVFVFHEDGKMSVYWHLK